MSTLTSQLFRWVVRGLLFALPSGAPILDLMIGNRLKREFDVRLATLGRALVAL